MLILLKRMLHRKNLCLKYFLQLQGGPIMGGMERLEPKVINGRTYHYYSRWAS